MSAKYISSNWRLLNQENSSKSDNYGLTYDGSNEYIDTTLDIDANSDFSISFWFNWNQNQKIIITDGNFDAWSTIGYGFQIMSNGSVRFLVGDNGSSTGKTISSTAGSISANTWNHIVGVCDLSNEIRLYLNGTSVDNTAVGSSRNETSNNLRIAGDYSSSKRLFDGSISEVAAFNYALSATQISTLYGSSSLGAGNPMALKPQPVAYYNLADNSASNPLTQPNEAVEDASVFSFDGSNDFIDVGQKSSLQPADAISISVWVKFNTIVDFGGILFTGNGNGNTGSYLLTVIGNNFYFYIRYGSTWQPVQATGFTITTGTWINVVATYDKENLKLYVNNSSPYSQAETNSLVYGASSSTQIGTYNTNYFDGSISNVQIWNTALSSTEVETLYNSGVPLLTGTQPQASNLKAWYKLDQSANWDVSSSGYWDIPDASGNGNSGISSGMTSASLVLSDLTRNLPYDSYSFNFDSASSDYIDLGDLSNIGISNASAVSVSLWFNRDTTTNQFLLDLKDGSSRIGLQLYLSNSIYFYVNNKSYFHSTSPSINQWYNLVYVFNGSGGTNAAKLKMYLNGTELTGGTYSGTIDSAIGSFTSSMTSNIGRIPSTSYFDGKISNLSIFDEALTSTQVMKLYSNGVPQDLSSFSPAPVSWWTLGSNSFFNGTNYICRDLIGSNDGTSANAGVDAIVGDSPRSSANGVGSNNSIPENLEGSTKYSSNNSWSINMSSEARTTDVP